MSTITQKIKNLSVSGSITLPKVLPVAEAIDQERTETIDLLKRTLNWVGMDLGADIRALIAKMEGKFFSEKEFNYERLPGEQGI